MGNEQQVVDAVTVSLGQLGTMAGIGITPYIFLLGFIALSNFGKAKKTLLRLNVLWLTTVVASLTAMFGYLLLSRLAEPGDSVGRFDVVLGSLVGGGIGGLLTIAGQLAQENASQGPGTEDGS